MEYALSFWGNIASIVGVTIAFFGVLYKYQGKYKEKLRLKQEALNESFSEIEHFASSATTQGKRLDLFIYKESVLAHARYYVLELRFSIVCRLILISLLFVMYFAVVPTSPTLYNITFSILLEFLSAVVDPIEASTNASYAKVAIGLIGLAMLFYACYQLLSVILSMKSCDRIERRLNRVSSIFLDSYKSNLGESHAAALMLDSAILREPE